MNKDMTRYEALLACRDQAGSVSQLGRDLGIPQSTMWRIIHQSKQLPAEYVLLAEDLYRVSRHALRPDIYPVALHPPSPRWTGVDQCAEIFPNRVVGRSNRVSFNNFGETKGARA
jgi:DNA-binding transcriptional regulator YdaS (Cro superfamily)